MNPLISLAVFSYRNTHYLYDCLDSVLEQTYDNIELIISNDCSDCFDIEAVRCYVEKNAKSNIKNVIINKNERNLGTVKHHNVVLDFCNGDYFTSISADDVYDNEQAVATMVEGFNFVPADTMCIVFKTEIWNEELNTLLKVYPTKQECDLINKLTPYELYCYYLVLRALPVSLIYKMGVFDKYGRYDEDYFIVEDWTSQISFAKQGMRYSCIDSVVLNRREGGVSSALPSPESFSQMMYIKDLIKLFENILKSSDEFNEDVKRGVNVHYISFSQIYNKVWGGKTFYLKPDLKMPPVIVFGAGEYAANLKYKINNIDIKYHIDNDPKKWGTQVNGKLVKPPAEVLNEENNNFIVLIMVLRNYSEIKAQLIKTGCCCAEQIYDYAEFCDEFFIFE